jgi:hypothetical protein
MLGRAWTILDELRPLNPLKVRIGRPPAKKKTAKTKAKPKRGQTRSRSVQ